MPSCKLLNPLVVNAMLIKFCTIVVKMVHMHVTWPRLRRNVSDIEARWLLFFVISWTVSVTILTANKFNTYLAHSCPKEVDKVSKVVQDFVIMVTFVHMLLRLLCYSSSMLVILLLTNCDCNYAGSVDLFLD